MKRLGVAGLIYKIEDEKTFLLLGRRDKDPNRGLFVLPGGGVEEGESLEQAFQREVMEETGVSVGHRYVSRWERPRVIELKDLLILVGEAGLYSTSFNREPPKSGGDLYDVQWFELSQLPPDISPVVAPVIREWVYKMNDRNWPQ